MRLLTQSRMPTEEEAVEFGVGCWRIEVRDSATSRLRLCAWSSPVLTSARLAATIPRKPCSLVMASFRWSPPISRPTAGPAGLPAGVSDTPGGRPELGT